MGGALSLESIQFLSVTNSNFNLNTVLNIPFCDDKLLYAYQEGGSEYFSKTSITLASIINYLESKWTRHYMDMYF